MTTVPPSRDKPEPADDLQGRIAYLENDLSEIRQRLRAVFETVCEGIITIDHRGIIDTANEAAGRLFGYAVEELAGKNVKTLMPDPYRSEHDQYISNYLDTGIAKIIGIGREVVGLKRDGTVFPLYLSVSEVVFDHRKLFTGFVQDLTERKAHEAKEAQWREELERRVRQRTEELDLANQELEHFTFTISHDLRTPLRGIRNYVDFLREDLEGRIEGESLEDLRRLGQAADELELMVQQILEYSRIGRSEIGIEHVDVNELIGSIRSALNPPLREAIRMEGRLPGLWAPRSLLRQIFQNLIENALRYNQSESPQVSIRASLEEARKESPPQWIFDIQDNGIGIDPRYHEKVFGMFQRLHSQSDYPGTGIGLTAVRKAVQFLNGRIEIESRPGEGTRFRILIPERQQERFAEDD
jgi:PAS domain S-box-containing protein